MTHNSPAVRYKIMSNFTLNGKFAGKPTTKRDIRHDFVPHCGLLCVATKWLPAIVFTSHQTLLRKMTSIGKKILGQLFLFVKLINSIIWPGTQPITMSQDPSDVSVFQSLLRASISFVQAENTSCKISDIEFPQSHLSAQHG